MDVLRKYDLDQNEFGLIIKGSDAKINSGWRCGGKKSCHSIFSRVVICLPRTAFQNNCSKKWALTPGPTSRQHTHFYFDRKQRRPPCCHYSWKRWAWSRPRGTQPPGYKCVSLSCGADFLILYCFLTGSICKIKCWVCHPLGDHMPGFVRFVL